MNNKGKIDTKILIAIVVIVIIAIIAVVGYTMSKDSKTDKNNEVNVNMNYTNNLNIQIDNNEEDNTNSYFNNETNSVNNSVDNTNTNNQNDNVNTKGETSSKTDPLSFNQWGLASRYSSGEYKDIPVMISKVTRGEQASKLVEGYCNEKNSIYKYEEPKEGMEWAVFEYTVDLRSIMTEYGVNVRVDSKITGTGDNSSIKYDGKTYIVSTADMSSRDYFKEDSAIADGRFVVQLPIGCTDYLVAMGTTNQTNAYFEGK